MRTPQLRWETHRLRVDVRRNEGGIWVAHCLELNAFAEAGSFRRATEFMGQVASQMIQHAAEEGFDPFGLPAQPDVIAEHDALRQKLAPGDLDPVEDLPEPPAGVHRVLLDLALNVPIFDRAATEAVRSIPLPPPHVCSHLLTTGSYASVGR